MFHAVKSCQDSRLRVPSCQDCRLRVPGCQELENSETEPRAVKNCEDVKILAPGYQEVGVMHGEEGGGDSHVRTRLKVRRGMARRQHLATDPRTLVLHRTRTYVHTAREGGYTGHAPSPAPHGHPSMEEGGHAPTARHGY